MLDLPNCHTKVQKIAASMASYGCRSWDLMGTIPASAFTNPSNKYPWPNKRFWKASFSSKLVHSRLHPENFTYQVDPPKPSCINWRFWDPSLKSRVKITPVKTHGKNSTIYMGYPCHSIDFWMFLGQPGVGNDRWATKKNILLSLESWLVENGILISWLIK